MFTNKLIFSLFFISFIFSKNPVVYEISIRPWLYELTIKYGRSITKLEDIPTEEFDFLQDSGIDVLYVMGIWKIGEYGVNYDKARDYSYVLKDWQEEDIIGSPFAITNYVCNPELGTNEDIMILKNKLNTRNIKLFLDFIPNHSALDGENINNKEMYIRAPKGKDDLTKYTSEGIAYGEGDSNNIWFDVIQYNYFEPQTIEYMIKSLKNVLDYSDGVICTQAYLQINDVFEETWKEELNYYNYTKPLNEFWSTAISEIKSLKKDAVFIAEAYTTPHKEKLIELGFDYILDDSLINKLLYYAGDINRYISEVNGNIWTKMVHFVENHDKNRIVKLLSGDNEKAKAAGTIAATIGGMALMNHGQWYGRQNKLDIHLRRAKGEEENYDMLKYYLKLVSIVKNPAFKGLGYKYVKAENEDFVAYIREDGDNHFLVVVNYSDTAKCSYVPLYNLKGFKYCLLYEAFSDEEYVKSVDILKQKGLQVCLKPWETQIFQYNY